MIKTVYTVLYCTVLYVVLMELSCEMYIYMANVICFYLQRNLRSFAFAKLYFNVGEHELARRYVSNYLVVKPHSAEAQLLLGKILEKLGRRESALEAYRTSLDLDPKQNGLVLKGKLDKIICTYNILII